MIIFNGATFPEGTPIAWKKLSNSAQCLKYSFFRNYRFSFTTDGMGAPEVVVMGPALFIDSK